MTPAELIAFIRETVAPYDGTHSAGYHGQDLMYARLRAIREAIEGTAPEPGIEALLTFIADLEAGHPSAWYCKERILFKIKALRELTGRAAGERIEP
jgi:hypothetical protein